MMSQQPYRLRPLETNDLELVRTWRNRPEVRANMYTRHEIAKDEHEAYFDRALSDRTKRYFLCVDASDEPVGVVSFVDIDHDNMTASWAFYSGDTSRRGIGTWMEFLALDYAFLELRLEKLQCEVLEWNLPVVEFHQKFGFSIEGIAKKQHVRENERYDVHRLAIHRREWLDYVRPDFEARLLHGARKHPFDPGARHLLETHFTHEHISQFCALSGDSNDIHSSDEAARAAGFEERVVPGMLIAALFSRVLGSEFPGPGTVYLRQEIAFERPVYPNRTILAEFRVLRRVGRRATIDTKVHDPHDRTVSTTGTASVLLPREAQNA